MAHAQSAILHVLTYSTPLLLDTAHGASEDRAPHMHRSGRVMTRRSHAVTANMDGGSHDSADR